MTGGQASPASAGETFPIWQGHFPASMEGAGPLGPGLSGKIPSVTLGCPIFQLRGLLIKLPCGTKHQFGTVGVCHIVSLFAPRAGKGAELSN
jgi:hypothetical protein